MEGKGRGNRRGSERSRNSFKGQKITRKNFRKSDDQRDGYKKRDNDSKREDSFKEDSNWFEKPKRYSKSRPSRPGGDRFKKDFKPGFKSRGNRNFSKSKREPQDLLDKEEVRLNKFIASSGICSRREADNLIEQGLISVNGKVVDQLGTKVKPGDDVRYGGERLSFEKYVYILMNKPKDIITSASDPQGRMTVLDIVSNHITERIYPVGRLDRQTTGLLLLTNDGDLAKRLTHPKHGITKTYQVTLNKAVTKADMQHLVDGVELEDGMSKVDTISYIADSDNKKEVSLRLHSGKNRVIRRMFEALGYTVTKLDRIAFAGLTKKRLLRGKWRVLTPTEVGMLKMNS
jgi:23S rRNA pseudouridine2605 synthase